MWTLLALCLRAEPSTDCGLPWTPGALSDPGAFCAACGSPLSRPGRMAGTFPSWEGPSSGLHHKSSAIELRKPLLAGCKEAQTMWASPPPLCQGAPDSPTRRSRGQVKLPCRPSVTALPPSPAGNPTGPGSSQGLTEGPSQPLTCKGSFAWAQVNSRNRLFPWDVPSDLPLFHCLRQIQNKPSMEY